MGEKRVNPRIVFLLVLLIAVGIFLLYSRLSFTGFVTSEYFSGSVTLNDFSNASVFENTKFDGVDAVVLDNLALEGVYTAPLFASPNETEVIWSNFAQNILLNPSISSATFYYRACNDVNCTGVDFIPINLSSSVVGKYFQYKVVMQTSGSSPKLYGVSIDYRTHLNLPISIESPQNITYNNETVLLKITANSSAVWFYNGTDNETYTSEINRTFSQGNYLMTAWVRDAYQNVNSTSVAFSVWFLNIYYRFANNACSTVSLVLPQKTANDYATLAECQSKITSSDTTLPLTTETVENCAPIWECDWGECVDGIQTEDCIDTSTCTTVAEPPPARTQSCTGGTVTTQPEVIETTPATTTTEETQKKGFLSIVGSVVTAPFTFVFGNTTRILIFLAALLLVIGGFLVYKYSLKTRLKVLKFLNLRKKKNSGEN